ncbi:MAG: type I restriction enzyme HsdR N-terminal domain-containing protein [Pseudomonadota bacterium]
MSENVKPYEMIADYITGEQVPLVGAEENRQMVEKLLVDEKGFSRQDIAVDVPIDFEVAGETYRSSVDLVVSIAGRPLMVVKCAAGSLGSREREAVSAARLVWGTPLPLAVVSDGRTAIVLETATGRPVAEGLKAIPDRFALKAGYADTTFEPLAGLRLEKERLVFRSYDSMNVNTARRLPTC